MKPFIALGLLASVVLASCAPQTSEPVGESSSSSFSSSMPSSSMSSAFSLMSASSASTEESSSSLVSNLHGGVDSTGLNLDVAPGISIAKFADGLTGARVIVKDSFGNFWVSRTSAGIVSQLEMSGSTFVRKNDLLRGLRNPHGLVIDPATGFTLYVAEETGVKRVHLYSDAPVETIAQLPSGDRHYTRTLALYNNRLFISIGSTCDACIEKNPEHGTIISMNLDGSDRKIVASGLRNAVFFDRHPQTQQIWATEMGRDMLGDDIPPEEINIIRDGANYGWPYCYGNRIRDTRISGEFDCIDSEPPYLTMQAHTAPLGLAFVPDSWPAEYRNDLLVAQHGSWNRSTPVGYKIIRIPLDAQGKPEGEPVDFITGWRDTGAAIGRPVDLFFDGNVLYVTDDKAGFVYKVTTR